MPKNRTPPKLVVRQLVKNHIDSGPKDLSSAYSQLVYAALGAVSPEIAARDDLPIHQFTEKGSGFIQYDRYEVIRRAQVVFKDDYWMATRRMSDVVDALRNARIGVGQVQLLLDPKYTGNVQRKAFSALSRTLSLNDAKDAFNPTTATLAIEEGLVPLPDTTWAGRFSLAASTPSRGPSELVEIVNSRECYLWEFPPTCSSNTATATLDRYHSEGRTHDAEMGMGFSIIEAPWKRSIGSFNPGYFNQYSLHTPLWDCRRTSENTAELKWRLSNIIHSAIRDKAAGSDSMSHHEDFAKLLPRGLTSLPRIYGCQQCRTLYIEESTNHPGVPTHCSCSTRITDGLPSK